MREWGHQKDHYHPKLPENGMKIKTITFFWKYWISKKQRQTEKNNHAAFD